MVTDTYHHRDPLGAAIDGYIGPYEGLQGEFPYRNMYEYRFMIEGATVLFISDGSSGPKNWGMVLDGLTLTKDQCESRT